LWYNSSCPVAGEAKEEAAMTDTDLNTLPPETFLRLALERGGLDLEEAIRGLSPEAAAALRHIAAASPADASKEAPAPVTRSAEAPPVTRSAEWPPTTRSAAPEPDDEPMGGLTRGAIRRATRSGGMRGMETRDARPRRHCPACGRPVPGGDRFCQRCGYDLTQAGPPITLDGMVAAEQLTATQADEVRQRLFDLQANYPAGTRYSVFGGPS
jgi:hypothetical protein